MICRIRDCSQCYAVQLWVEVEVALVNALDKILQRVLVVIVRKVPSLMDSHMTADH